MYNYKSILDNIDKSGMNYRLCKYNTVALIEKDHLGDCHLCEDMCGSHLQSQVVELVS